MEKRFLHLTLASNGNAAVIAADNIAFAARITEEERSYTRVFLKQVVMNEENKWVDVNEEPEEFR